MNSGTLRSHRVRSMHPTARRKTATSPRRLRVAIVAETFVPAINGVTNSVRRVAHYLVGEGHEVLVVAPSPGPEVVDGVRVKRVRSVEFARYGDLHIGLPSRSVGRIIEDFKPDVVHCAAPLVLGVAGLRAARRLGVPAVAVYQTDIAGFAKRHGLSFASGSLWRWLRWAHSQADLTLAPSTASVWDLRQHGVSRVARWMRGVDTAAFNPRHRDEELRSSLVRPGEVLIGYVGRLAREKQLELLGPLLALEGVRLVIVGDGPHRARLEDRLRGATFAGLQTGSDLSRYVASLDIFVHTGVDETFCQALQEALAAGVPVVAPAAGGPMDLVHHGVNGFLWSPTSSTALVGAVDELVRSPLQRGRMAAAARSTVAHRTWSNVNEELVGHYRSVMSGLAFAYAQLPQ